jgi:hypothetical protein
MAGDVDGNLWIDGGRRVSADGPFVQPDDYLTLFPDALLLFRALPASDGTVWGDSRDAGLLHLDPVAGTAERFLGPEGQFVVTSALLDALDRPWVYLEGKTHLWRLGAGGWEETIAPVANLNDVNTVVLSRAHIRGIARAAGRWIQVVDTGFATATLRELRWSEKVEGRARLVVKLQVSARPDFAQVMTCWPDAPGHVDIVSCAGGKRWRYARIQVDLYADSGGHAPSIRDIELTWDHP